MMKKALVPIFFTLLLYALPGFGQNLTDVQKKEVLKAVKTFNSGKMQKGIDQAEKLLVKYPDQYKIWNIVIDMYAENFRVQNQKMSNSLNDMIANAIKESMSEKKSSNESKSLNIDVFQQYLQAQLQYKNALRRATLTTRNTYPSLLMRSSFVNDIPSPRKAKQTESIQAFQEAEKLFRNKQYEQSIPFYRIAIEKSDTTFYSAILYLGDAYYMINEYDSAQKYFEYCVKEFPGQIEAPKFLADCYGAQNNFEGAIDACVQALLIYPDQALFYKLEDAAEGLKKIYDDGWIKRGVYPYFPNNPFTNNYPQPWNDYVSYARKAWSQSDSLGVIKDPSLFDGEKYAEVYAWKMMLEKNRSKFPELTYAANMLSKGYLDCYVFISLFHYDLLPSYRAFVKENKEKIKTYISQIVIYS